MAYKDKRKTNQVDGSLITVLKEINDSLLYIKQHISRLNLLIELKFNKPFKKDWNFWMVITTIVSVMVAFLAFYLNFDKTNEQLEQNIRQLRMTENQLKLNEEIFLEDSMPIPNLRSGNFVYKFNIKNNDTKYVSSQETERFFLIKYQNQKTSLNTRAVFSLNSENLTEENISSNSTFFNYGVVHEEEKIKIPPRFYTQLLNHVYELIKDCTLDQGQIALMDEIRVKLQGDRSIRYILEFETLQVGKFKVTGDFVIEFEDILFHDNPPSVITLFFYLTSQIKSISRNNEEIFRSGIEENNIKSH